MTTAKYTIKEIARMAGVSAAAVSYVLNGKKGISEETRKKIESIIKTINFVPNPNSRRLFYNKGNNIGWIIDSNAIATENLFYMELTSGLVHSCEEKGYNLVFSTVSMNEDVVRIPNIIKSRDVEGIILHCDTNHMIANEIDKYNLPIVFVDSFIQVSNRSNVFVDYEEAAYMATRYLIEKGHQKICCLNDGDYGYFALHTFNGFKKAIEESGITVPINWTFFEASKPAKVKDFVQQVMASAYKPTALFCTGDIFAVYTINALYDLGYKVPDDVSVIGIDDIIMSAYIRPSLTTVRIDKNQMGIKALDILLDMIESGPDHISNIKVPLQLVERASVKNIR
jgi:DNA-binding LacI/PurR family transcriptional regulator